MHNKSLVQDLWEFVKTRKAWWLVPTILMLLVIGFLIVAAQSSVVSPFIYAMF